MKADVERLFHELADLSPGDRSRYLAAHPADQNTRLEVEALLAFDSSATSYLIREISLAASQALPQLEGKGCRCGPYRLLGLIGRGGMGAVYLAERADGEAAERLAVKLLPPGAGDPHHERFLQERQILSSLAHPNIARMLDAGTLANGQPFLAMEYVEGKPLDVFAEGLNLRQIIALFLKVCAPVAALHRHLIVHRDLKPANILVTADGEPKLLDFGIAKMLDLATDATRTSLRMLTPDYASPEQVTGGRTSTAIDIYTLGAVLYRLLTGRPPHQFEDHSPEAIARAVTSQEVVRPSRWAPELKGDLECILLKALRKDPQERYGTVEQFADDLNAFLESRPVRARGADWRYRTRKFVRRYWMPVSAAALVTLSLATGLYIADRQRAVAEQRVAQLRRLSERLLDFETQLTGPNAGSDLELHRKLAATSIQYLESLGPEVLRDRKLALEIGTTYLHMARIEGVPVWNQQGQYEQAKKSLSKVVELASGVLAAEPGNRQALWLVANAAHDRAVVASTERRPEQVSEDAPKVVAGFERLARLGNLTRKEINGATYIYGDLAGAFVGLDRFQEAVRYARLGIDYSRDTKTVPGPRAQAFNMLANALQYLGDLDGSQAAVQEARRLWEQLRRDEGDMPYTRFILCQTRLQEGLLLGEDGSVNLGRPREGAGLLEEGFDAVEAVAQKDANNYEMRMALAETGHYLGDMLRHLDARRARAVYDRALERSREIPTDIAARRMEALLLAGSSYAARRLGNETDARLRIEGAFDVLRKIGDYPSAKIEPRQEVFAVMRAQADDDAEAGEPERAIATEQELRGAIGSSKLKADEDLPLAAALSELDASLAGTLRRAGRSGESAAIEAERRELWQRWDRKLPNNAFVRRQMAGAALP